MLAEMYQNALIATLERNRGGIKDTISRGSW